MTQNELIQEYNIKKQQVKKLREELNIKESMIYFSDNGDETASFMSGKCIVHYVHMEPPVFNDVEPVYSKIKHCKNFDNCELQACKGYNNYLNYVNALKNYKVSKQELRKYPWWVKICSVFQRSE